MVRLFDPSPRRPFYPPARHREMISKIIRHVNMTVSFADSPGKIKLPDAGEIEERTDANQTGHIVLRRWGSDSESRVRSLLRRWCLDRLETIYLYLPLYEPATAVFCPAFEEMRFFFAGLKPGRAGEDWLVLQFLNNQRYDYRLLKAATPFGRELIAYVRACDPVSKEERGVSV
jgi:serine/threonine-protein kinase RsbW